MPTLKKYSDAESGLQSVVASKQYKLFVIVSDIDSGRYIGDVEEFTDLEVAIKKAKSLIVCGVSI